MRALAHILVLVAFGLSLAGCDKCGSFYIGRTQKVCHDESDLK